MELFIPRVVYLTVDSTEVLKDDAAAGKTILVKATTRLPPGATAPAIENWCPGETSLYFATTRGEAPGPGDDLRVTVESVAVTDPQDSPNPPAED